jgi:hypothetical protein
MPPQQPKGPLDLVDDALSFRAHGSDLAMGARQRNAETD